MRRFMTTSMFVSVVLLAGALCLAEDTKPDAAGAKTDSPEMWEAYKKMWEGQWETTFTMSEDATDGSGLKRGEKIEATMTDEVILDGNGMLITRIIRNAQDQVISQQKCLASWCPKEKAILLRELSSDGARSDGVIMMLDGQEHHRSTHTDAKGNQTVIRLVVTGVDKDNNRLQIVEGPLSGFEITWKRKSE